MFEFQNQEKYEQAKTKQCEFHVCPSLRGLIMSVTSFHPLREINCIFSYRDKGDMSFRLSSWRHIMGSLPLSFFLLWFKRAGKSGLRNGEAEKMIKDSPKKNHRLRRKADDRPSVLSSKYRNPTLGILELLIGCTGSYIQARIWVLIFIMTFSLGMERKLVLEQFLIFEIQI